ncbi:MAG: PepSY domain-containing protein [Verrucomicrobiae bacterium]|nr:PepSY domain-containing protein [Verrucomicrobiae bacterium]MCB1086051.1 PepSY domain-containing protein [Verrucomicrobiae bacterium]
MPIIEAKQQPVPRRFNARLLKLVRRAHLYTGLLLLPWVIFFGFSGMLFNHPEWFGPVKVETVRTAAEVDRLAQYPEPDAARLASEVVKQLNDGAETPRYRIADTGTGVIDGTLNFEGKSESGERVLVILSPNQGGASVRRFPNAAPQDKPDFHERRIELVTFDKNVAQSVASVLASDAGLKLVGDLTPVERGGAELRFRAQSISDGRLWNVTCQLMSGVVTARASDAASGLDFYSILSRLHKTHHYPDRRGARWAWSAFADATGITMVFWGVSGAIMWWQLKPTRLIGALGLSLAGVAAAIVFSGTFADLTFAPARPTASGGGAPSNREAGNPSPKSRTPAANDKVTAPDQGRQTISPTGPVGSL